MNKRFIITFIVATIGIFVFVACGSTATPTAASATTAKAAYDGEFIEIVNPFSPTGGTGRWLALLQPYLEKHIDGSPTVEAISRSGASGVSGGNFFEGRPADGFTLFASSGSNVFPYVFGESAVLYDFSKYTPVLGSPVGGVVYTNPDTGLKNASGLCDATGLVYGAISPTGLDVVMLVTFELLGYDQGNTGQNVQVVVGFEGRGSARAAFQSAETNFDFQTSPAYQSNIVPLVESGDAVPLFTFGILDDNGKVIRDPTYPDFPSFAEVYNTCTGSDLSGVEEEVYKAVLVAGFAAQKNLWVKTAAPADLKAELLQAAERIVADSGFQTDKKKEVGEYKFSVGQEAADNFKVTSQLSDAAFNWLVNFLNDHYQTGLDLRE